MEVLVRRDIFNDDCTIGEVSVDGKFVCFSLEDSYREGNGGTVEDWKIPGQTAIPKGRYPLVIDYSNRFGKYLCLIEGVPGFTGVRIHSGNTKADTEGCILVGMAHTLDAVQHSKDALKIFQPMVQQALNSGQGVWIQVE